LGLAPAAQAAQHTSQNSQALGVVTNSDVGASCSMVGKGCAGIYSSLVTAPGRPGPATLS